MFQVQLPFSMFSWELVPFEKQDLLLSGSLFLGTICFEIVSLVQNTLANSEVYNLGIVFFSPKVYGSVKSIL